MGWLNRLFGKLNKQEDDFESYEESWSEVVYHRENLDIHDDVQRREYIQGCLEQIADAAMEVEGLSSEYSVVTSNLTDMEEIEALPPAEKRELEAAASRVATLQEQKETYQGRTGKMTDAQFHQMEMVQDEVEEGLRKLKEAEEYQVLVKRDLSRLDAEKHAFRFRKVELQETILQCKSVAMVCTIMVFLALAVLLILQFSLELETGWGFVFTVAVGVTVYAVVYFKHQEAASELKKLGKDMNRLIQLQNTVKIRYVNNTNLLDYLYMKYKVKNARELEKLKNDFQEEKEAREKFRQARFDLDENEEALIKLLRKYRIKDPALWLHQVEAILDHREMVEIRHNLIIRRQSLRKRMDYNKDVIVGNAKKEIKDLVDSYPRYAKEILDMVDKYM